MITLITPFMLQGYLSTHIEPCLNQIFLAQLF